MEFFNDAMKEAFRTGRYICSQCGADMEFEDEWKDVLVCNQCGHSMDLDRYGCESDEEYEALYPTYEEIVGEEEPEDDEDYTGEVYDEVCGELSDD